MYIVLLGVSPFRAPYRVPHAPPSELRHPSSWEYLWVTETVTHPVVLMRVAVAVLDSNPPQLVLLKLPNGVPVAYRADALPRGDDMTRQQGLSSQQRAEGEGLSGHARRPLGGV